MSSAFIRSVHMQDTASVECKRCGKRAMRTLRKERWVGKRYILGDRPCDLRCTSCRCAVIVHEVNGVPVQR